MANLAKRFATVIIILAIIFGGTFAWYVLKLIMTKQFFATHQEPPVAVSTTIAVKQTWHPILKSVGTLQAVNGVKVNSEVMGQVIKIYFKSGQFVKEGVSLVQLDDAINQQKLNNYLAGLRLAKISYKRQLALYRTRSTSKANLDKVEAKMLESEAEVAGVRVMIQKKNIKAPFAGKLGIRQINLGEYVKAGQPMVLLQSLNPLFVNFDLPEQFLSKVFVGQEVQIKTDVDPEKIFTGKVTAVNSSVAVMTRSISVQATFPNDKGELYPGLFADVSLIEPKKVGVITVPQTAVTYSLYGDSIYVINPGKDKFGKPALIANQKFVTVGDRRGTVIAIKKGIKVGDQIVTSGQLKLHPGARIVVNNSIKLN